MTISFFSNVGLQIAKERLPEVADEYRNLYLGLVEYVSEKGWRIEEEVAKQLPKLFGKEDNATLVRHVDLIIDLSQKSRRVAIEMVRQLPEILYKFNRDIARRYVDILYSMSDEIMEGEKSVHLGQEELELLRRQLAELERQLGEQRKAQEEKEKKAAEVARCLSEMLREVEEDHRDECLRIVRSVVERDYEVAVEVASRLPDLARQMPTSRLREWVDYGLRMLEGNSETARMYFRLESKTSWEVLERLKSGVALKDVARLLKLYASALSGKEVAIKSIQDLPEEVRGSSGDAPCCDGKDIYLPPEVREFLEDEDNFRVYKLSTTHKAAHMEFGTYDFDMEEIPEVVQKISERYGGQSDR